MRKQEWKWGLGLMALGCSAALALGGCGSSGGHGDSEPADGDTTSEVADGDSDSAADIDSEAESEASEDSDSEWVGEKCSNGRNYNDVDVKTANGAHVQICKEGEELDAAGVEIGSMVLAADMHIKIEKGEDLALDGWKTVGPAVRFVGTPSNSGGMARFNDVATFTIPFDMKKLEAGTRNFYINVLFKLDADASGLTAVNNGAPFLLPKGPTLVRVDRARGLVATDTHFFGTFQVVVPTTLGTATTRHFTYRAMTGISMGAGGTIITGLMHPEKFDILGPLGGIMDMTYLAGLIHDFHLGGFCSADQIDAESDLDSFLDDLNGKCGWCGEQHDPDHWSTPNTGMCYLTKPRDMYAKDEHEQGFNHWYYDSNGGNFNRNEYIKLFRDLVYAYGNFSNYNPSSPYLPVGLTGDRLTKYLTDIYTGDEDSDQVAACAKLAEWMAQEPIYGIYDREYNPDGSVPAIFFCDGTSQATSSYDPSDPDAHKYRIDLAVAFDYNHNGIRDFGEPVLRQFSEPYEDCGTDGLCDSDEPGYDPQTNPDPNHDDYNPYTNVLGTEGNGRYDEGEKYQDVGIDGVACPSGKTCDYDYGEGNGKFDYNPNLAYFLSFDPRTMVLTMDEAKLQRLNFYYDGGIRDVFNFGLMADNLAAAVKQRTSAGGASNMTYNDFPSMTPIVVNGNYNFVDVDYAHLGKNVHVRYGDYNADDATVASGDGRHVGSTSQVIGRLATFFAFANAHFPNGDYTKVPDYDVSNLVQTRYFNPVSLGRTQRYAVTLPPGYYTNNKAGTNNNPDTCVNRYPVIYILHGYGQEPADFAPAIAIFFPYIASGMFQKFITVFPDGRCYSPDRCVSDCQDDCKSSSDATCSATCIATRKCSTLPNECRKGTFYADHVALESMPRGSTDTTGFKQGQNQQALLELMGEVDKMFCTKAEEDVQVDKATMDGLY